MLFQLIQDVHIHNFITWKLALRYIQSFPTVVLNFRPAWFHLITNSVFLLFTAEADQLFFFESTWILANWLLTKILFLSSLISVLQKPKTLTVGLKASLMQKAIDNYVSYDKEIAYLSWKMNADKKCNSTINLSCIKF